MARTILDLVIKKRKAAAEKNKMKKQKYGRTKKRISADAECNKGMWRIVNGSWIINCKYIAFLCILHSCYIHFTTLNLGASTGNDEDRSEGEDSDGDTTPTSEQSMDNRRKGTGETYVICVE